MTPSERVTVVAEAGVNHDGDIEVALDLVRAAHEAGADLVKFQYFRTGAIVAPETRTAAYQARNTGTQDQSALLRAVELDLSALKRIAEECHRVGIGFLCTPFDWSDTAALVGFGMPALKVASGELTNVVALRHFAGFGLPIWLSTGMADLDEVGVALHVLQGAGASEITLLHCTSLYPAPTDRLNLRAIATLGQAFGRPVGYSDHSIGATAAIAAVALGARIVEKHLTLDRTRHGPDHAASMEPADFAALVASLRATEQMLGNGRKEPAPGECEVAQLVRRSWHAARDLAAGQLIGPNDVALVRPADGLPPAAPVIGARTKVAVARHAPITAADIAQPSRVEPSR